MYLLYLRSSFIDNLNEHEEKDKSGMKREEQKKDRKRRNKKTTEANKSYSN